MVRAALIVLAAFMLAGCATSINWQSRVGVYTYDQAVAAYGPPDKYAKLSNGSTVAEWKLKQGAVVTTPGPYYYGSGYYYGPGYTTAYFPAKFLRLTFSPNGKLAAWKEYSK